MISVQCVLRFTCERKMSGQKPRGISKEYFVEGRKKIRLRLLAKYGQGPHSKEIRQKINKEVIRKMALKNRARLHYEFMKIQFENRKVRLNVPKFGYKKLSFRPSQLIRHFTPQEIRRAAAKYMKLKLKLDL